MSKRYLFHGGTREMNADGTDRKVGKAHNSAFYFAATNVEKDYKDSEKLFVKITTAADMVRMINSNTKNSIKSLDIFSHGTPYSLNFSITENENCGLVTGVIAKVMLSIHYTTWDDGIYTFSDESKYVSDIDFSKFSDDARVQIHGCNTAKGTMPGDTLVETFSEELFEAGKKKSYVIGHTDKSNPNINGDKTTIKQQDYRHGERAIYSNGKLVKKTTKEGIIPHDKVQKILRGIVK